MRIFDFSCPACGHCFEDLVRTPGDAPACPQCGAEGAARKPVLQMAIRTSNTRRGRTINLASNACPCAAHGPARARH
jgi:putative FmdB family regulatory protein